MARSTILYLALVVLLSVGAAWVVWRWPTVSPPVPSAIPSSVEPVTVTERSAKRPGPDVPIRFSDVTESAGIHFRHFDGPTPMHYIMETMGSGVGWLDYDGDGLMDLFLVQGSTFVAPAPDPLPTCKLFKNLGGGKFRDVTAEVGLGPVGCGQGVAVGDIDNDGFPDVFVTCFGSPNVLFHNVPDGKGGRRFVDVTKAAGLGSHPDWKSRPNFSTSAAFLDYNNDGLLDLFVCSYVKVDLSHYPDCKFPDTGHRYSCPPSLFEGTRCVLYRNNGNGTFTDVSHEAGIDLPNAKALGVVAVDFDDDGLVDLFVANDGVPNFLVRNTGKGRFEAQGPACGCTVNLNGQTQAYMGVDAEDVHGRGLPDLFVTAFSFETNSLFRNEGRCQFLDVTHRTGLGPPSWFMLGFGTAFLDGDNDGSPDLAVVNGHVSRNIEEDRNGSVPFRQKAQFFWNNGKGHFHEIQTAGDYFHQPHVGRGLALADFDNDGRMDLAVSNNGEAAYLLRNETPAENHWIRLELRGTKSNRDAVGAKVTMHAGGRVYVRHRKGGGSYLSAHDPRLLVGLGSAATVDRLEIRWPSGLVQKVGPLVADHGYRVTEGSGVVENRP